MITTRTKAALAAAKARGVAGRSYTPRFAPWVPWWKYRQARRQRCAVAVAKLG
jgi:hypothetical protein